MTRQKVDKILVALHGRGKAGKTVNSYLEAIRALCNYAVENDFLEKNPLAKMTEFNDEPCVRQPIQRSLDLVRIWCARPRRPRTAERRSRKAR